MNRYSTDLRFLLKSIIRHKELIFQLTKREILGKYRGSYLGLLWSLFNPLIMLAVYTFVFGIVFNAKWGINNENQLDFATILFSGLTIFNLFSENFNRAPTLISSNMNYVKKVIFPLEILPFITYLSSIFHLIISLSILIVMFAVTHGFVHWTWIFIFLILIPYSILIISLSYILTALGVFLKDVSHVITHLTTVILFSSPVFFSVERIPEQLRIFFYFNPLTIFLESSRDVLIFGKFPDFAGLAISFIISSFVLKLCFWMFQKTRRGFADAV